MSGVLDKSFDVLVPELGIIKRVYCQVNMSPYTYYSSPPYYRTCR